MRDSNYKSLANNKAAVTITTSLYDRRALDVTSDKPLVYSLNHLTYLVSSSAKVRETLSVDGGIERLIEILNECHHSSYSAHDNVFNSEKKLLTAWKWTLAFQCLVLIGTRGTERIRQSLVKAGILPIIATILDSYILLNESVFYSMSARPSNSFSENPVLQRQTSLFQDNTASFGRGTNSNRAGSTTPVDNNAYSLYMMNENAEIDTNDSLNVHAHGNRANSFNIDGENNGLRNVNTTGIEELQGHTTGALSYANMTSHIEGAIPCSPFRHNSTVTLSNNFTCEDYSSLNTEQLFKLLYVDRESSNLSTNTRASVRSEIRRKYLILNILRRLYDEKKVELLDDRFIEDNDYEMDNSLQFLSDLYLQNDKAVLKSLMNSRIAPRSFTESGVVIPKDDDIVWSLQLLAYISKYPCLKESLQNTHLLMDMSIRDKQLKLYIEKQMKSKLKESLILNSNPKLCNKAGGGTSLSNTKDNIDRFTPSASSSPQMLNDLNRIQNDDFVLDEHQIEVYDDDITEHIDGKSDYDAYDECEEEDDEEDDDEDYLNNSDEEKYMPSITSSNENDFDYLTDLYNSIVASDRISNEMEREFSLFTQTERINKYIEFQAKKLSGTVIDKRKEQKSFLSNKWNYETYKSFDIDNEQFSCSEKDYDESLMEYKTVNLFPMVEKFTFLSGTDMYYWSGVIMRNSCRRNETKGGVRQCGNLECGKWEKYPREFSKCRKCKRTKYCSRECQIKAWNCHRNWCIPSNSSSTTTSTAAFQGNSTNNTGHVTSDDQNNNFSSQSHDEAN